MKVLKFGTSTIASIEKFKIVKKIVSQASDSIIILSAMADTTRKLEEISDYLYKKNPEGANESINILEKEYLDIIDDIYTTDSAKTEASNFIKEKIRYIRSFTKDIFTLFEEKVVLAQGEMLSTGLFTFALKEEGADVCEISALDFMRVDRKNEPDLNAIQTELEKILSENKNSLYITQGYICQNAYGEIDNFNFGGSDYTASLISAAIQAEEVQIWTGFDVRSGEDTRVIFNSNTTHHINFDEAAELAYFGAKILHPLCILPAKMANIPVRLLNILELDAKGTLISNETEKGKIKAIGSKDGITVINIKSSRMLLAYGFLRKVCEIFEIHKTAIDMLTTSEVGLSISIDSVKYLNEITNDLKKLGIVNIEQNMTIISVVGDLKQTPDSPVHSVLDTLKTIPFVMLSFGGSPFNISFITKQSDKEKTLTVLKNNIF